VATTNAQAKPVTQVDLQIPLAFYDMKYPGATALPLLSALKNTANTTLGTQFGFSYANGCLGDSTTGFETGDVLNCGAKWTLKLNPNSGSSRFYYKSPASVTNKLRVGPGILAPRLSTVLEPGILLGARDLLDAPFYTPQARYMCEQVEAKFYKIPVDDYGCPAGAVMDCGDNSEFKCTGTCTALEAEIIRAKIVNKNTQEVIMPLTTLREIGDLYGNRFCPAGHISLTGSLCTCSQVAGKMYCYPAGCTKQ
jgi:hypothetical protein